MCPLRLGVFSHVATGIPNTIDACRFREAEIERFATWWTGEATMWSIPQVKERLDELRVPDTDQQTLLDNLGKELEAPKREMPWWVRVVCEHREQFARCGLAFTSGLDDEVCPGVIYIVSLAIQQPVGLHMLEGKLRLPEWPAIEVMGDTEALGQLLFLARYEVGVIEHTDAADIGSEDAQILVFPDLLHVPGGVVARVAPHRIRGLLPSVPPPGAQVVIIEHLPEAAGHAGIRCGALAARVPMAH